MSQYLRHLAALTLNRIEPVQPRLASRFETPVEQDFSPDKEPDTTGELAVANPVRSHSPPVNVTENSAAQKVGIPRAETSDQPARQEPSRLVERTEFIIRNADLSNSEQASPLARNSSTISIEPANRVVSIASSPVTQVSNIRPDKLPPVETSHTIIERVQEHFTETTHNELIIREILATPDVRQKIATAEHSPQVVAVKSAVISEPASVETTRLNRVSAQTDKENSLDVAPRLAPVKPMSITVHADQTVGSNTRDKTDTQTDTQPAVNPTIQVTIGRIEIRATQVADKPAAKARASSTTMSLDDYLKQRNGGRS